MIATIDPALRQSLRRTLEERGESFLVLEEGANIVQSVLKQNPSLVILDLYLTNPSGIEILRRLRTLGFPGKVVVLGGQSVQTLAPEACRLGAFQIVGRPFNPNQILCAARVASGALDHDPVPT
ncbi:MAG: response regulator [Nitrospirales bacterium]